MMEERQNIENILHKLIGNSNKQIFICVTSRCLSFLHSLDKIIKDLMDFVERKGGKVKCITEIDSENIFDCKEFVRLHELRHLNKLKANFVLNDIGEFISITTSPQNTKGYKEANLSFVYSNSEVLSKQQLYIFETLWNRTTSGIKRIKDIEEGIESKLTDIIYTEEDFVNKVLKITRNTKEEIMLILASSNTFNYSLRFGAFDMYEKLIKQCATIIKILISTPLSFESKARFTKEELEQEVKRVYEIIKYIKKNMPNVEFGFIDKTEQVKGGGAGGEGVSILIIDHKEVIIWKIKDNNLKENFHGSDGYAIYSNERPFVLTYHSIFESLWRNNDVRIKLQSYTEELQRHEKLQKEFIDIIAHELRTPTHAILGYCEMVLMNEDYKNSDVQNGGYLKAIQRNADRLYNLLEEILNVTRIDNRLIQLNKEPVKIKELVLEVIDDFRTLLSTKEDYRKNIKIIFKDSTFSSVREDDLMVFVDKTKIYEVLSNLLDNAIKFSKSGLSIEVKLQVIPKPRVNYGDTTTNQTAFPASAVNTEAVNTQAFGNRNNNSVTRIGTDDKNESYDTESSNKKTKAKSTDITKDTSVIMDKSMVIVSITDRGMGINTSILHKIFDKFVTNSSVSIPNTGTGLGLYIAKNMIEVHGGRIWAENNKDGPGATISFGLPLYAKSSLPRGSPNN